AAGSGQRAAGSGQRAAGSANDGAPAAGSHRQPGRYVTTEAQPRATNSTNAAHSPAANDSIGPDLSFESRT
ncbi:hypothetical protein ABT112_25150, partial [Streptomyces sp. NPDC002055]|uniref:hypothetical protein n=1 Tax=Streptomyces sp. NPDC002055 TaxID=3154534 RepID=UPI003321DDC6